MSQERTKNKTWERFSYKRQRPTYIERMGSQILNVNLSRDGFSIGMLDVDDRECLSWESGRHSGF